MPRPAHEVVKELADAFTNRDWLLVRSLYHPHARLATAAGGDETTGPEETVRVLQRALADPIYKPVWHQIVAVDERAAIVKGRVRYRNPRGRGFADSARTWIFTTHNGRVWRGRSYNTEAEARAAYAQLGVDLGIRRLAPALAAQD